MKATMLLLCVALPAPPTAAQTGRPTFEVASVKKLDQPPSSIQSRSAGVTFTRTNTTVIGLIQFAYDVQPFEIVGGPDWVRQDAFEVNARAARELSLDEMRPLVQSLLEERFKLVVRREPRDMRHSELVLARDDHRIGAGLKPCVDPKAPLARPAPPPSGGTILMGRCQSIPSIAKIFASFLQNPVVDRTGLAGTYDFQIVFVDPRRLSAGAGGTDPNVPSFATAVQDELGLKLEATRGAVDVVVIESVQQPTEN